MQLTLADIPLTQEFVQHLFDYNPETGHLIWKNPLTNRVRKGRIAGAIDRGYYRIGIHNNRYDSHRIIWLYVYGYFPENEIDHIDRNRLNNKLSNLREVSRQCNHRNINIQANNSSGVSGICFVKRDIKWMAHIKVSGKHYNLGQYEDYIDAACARLAAEQCLDWNDCDANSTAYNFVQDWLNNTKVHSVTGY